MIYRILKKNQKEMVERCQYQEKAILEIQSAFSKTKKPLFIKGISAAVLCDTVNYLRYSSDVDLFYDDIAALREKLFEMGFHEVIATPAPHEDSFFERDGVLIEVHRYYPVLMEPDYPSEGYKLRKQLHLPDIEIRKLKFKHLHEHSTIVHNSISNGIFMPNAPMTVFILAAHLYKDLFWQPYKIPKIRLAELFELADLLKLPDFKFSELDDLAAHFKAGHILNFAFSIMNAVLYQDIPEGYRFVDRPLVKLMNDSFSPYMVADRSYFWSLPFATYNQTVGGIGCASCIADHVYSTSELKETYYASTSAGVHDFIFQVRQIQDKLEFKFNVDQKMADYDNFCVLLDEDVFTHIWLDKYPSKLRVYGETEYSIEKQENAYEIKICLPIPTSAPYYAVLAMGKQDGENKAVTVLPIKLE